MSQPRHDDPRPLLRVLALTLVVALAALAGLAGLERPAAAQTAGSRNLYFDGTPDRTLPDVSRLNQILGANANDGYVQFPFSAPDIRAVLAGSQFNGTLERNGRSYEIRTGAGTPGFSGDLVYSDRLEFGLGTSSYEEDDCYWGVTRQDGGDPERVDRIAVTFLVGDEDSPGAKLGYIRIDPRTLGLDSQYLCVRRRTTFAEVNTTFFESYDPQISSTMISSDRIVTDFAGSLDEPEPAVERDAAEPAAEPEPDLEPEADQEQESADQEQESADDAQEEAAAESEESAEEAAPAPADTTEGTTAAAGTDQDDAQSTSSETSATPTLAAEDDGPSADAVEGSDGSSALIPVLLGLIVALLAGLLLVLVRRNRPGAAASQPVAGPAAAAAPAPAAAEPSGLGVADEGGAEGDAEAP